MANEVKVSVVEFGDRPHYQMQWKDPVTNRKKTKSTGIERTGRPKDRKEAEKVAAKHEAALREGRYCEPSKVTWEIFRERYETEVLSGLADNTVDKVGRVFDVIERLLSPAKLRDLSEQRISHYQAKLREMGRSESTIKGHLSHLKAALRWAESVGLLPKAPRIAMPKRAKGSKGTDPMKGRPIATEEFERMLDRTLAGLAARKRKRTKEPPKSEATRKPRDRKPKAISEEVVESWRQYLRGLWTSGLRISESLVLSWDADASFRVDFSGRFPMFRVPAESEKGNKDRLLAMAPEFCEFLEQTPEHERKGYVFNPIAPATGKRASRNKAVRTVGAIGQAANVKVSEAGKPVKYASAHDLRRSFGERWASRVMPNVLKELMRHESIETTLRFYVGRNAQQTASVLWEAYKSAASGNTSGNSGDSGDSADCRKSVAGAGIEPARP